MFNHFINFCFFLLCSIGFPLVAYSSHIVGGEISYTFLGHNLDKTFADYEVTLKLYRDPKGIPYDDVASFGIFVQEPWGAWKSYDVITQVPISNRTEIARDNDPCRLRSLNEERLQSACYTFTVSLEVGETDYMISYQKCCRNFTINNIIGGGEVGSVYDIIIGPEAQKQGNSSPKFTTLPPIFICAGYNLNVINTAVDEEGDELVYSFCTPLLSGGPFAESPGCCDCQSPDPSTCIPPYTKATYEDNHSEQNPLGNPLVSIDPESGLITGVPELTGSYVVAVCLEEYRNGELLSRTRRDFEFNVVNCIENLSAKIDSDMYQFDETVSTQDSIAYFELCNETTVRFENLSGDLGFIRDYEWQFYNENGNQILVDNGFDKRDYQYDFPGPGRYEGLMILNDGITCQDTAYMRVNIIAELDVSVEIDFDSCQAGPVRVNGMSNHSGELIWQWNIDDGSNFMEQSFVHDFVTRGDYSIDLSVTDAYGCAYDYTDQISWRPYRLMPPDTIETKLFICQSDSVLINSNWEMDEGKYVSAITSKIRECDSIVEIIDLIVNKPLQTELFDTICMGDFILFGEEFIELTGTYVNNLISVDGCDSIVSLHVEVAQNLTRIDLEDDLLIEYGSTIILEPEIRGGPLIASEWFENGTIISTEQELTYTAIDDNWLFFESVNELFCVAVDSVFIKTELNRSVYFPNIITPDGDGVNDIFNLGANISVERSQLSVYDRWGKLIYAGPETDSRLMEIGWDGTYNGELVEIGVYVYVARVQYVDGMEKLFQGDVSVVR